jgi:hypothetical protein
MDELIIDDKKYVSSKQAAKITGYAKDYIGQLCREGRVPARLVGRSWYVLEAAISDHRFGAVAVESAQNSPKNDSLKTAPLSAHMEAPRYEAVPVEAIMPSEPRIDVREAESEPSQVEDLHESWRAWFSQAPIAAESVTEEEIVPIKREVEEEYEEEGVSEEVSVPVRAIHHTLYQPSEVETMPRLTREYIEDMPRKEDPIPERVQKRSVPYMLTFQLFGGMLTLAIVAIAALGTGYFDEYLLTSKEVSLVAGVSLYNR